MSLEPEVGISKETVYDGKLLKVIREVVRLPNGKERPREIVEHPGAVALVPVDKEGKVILVRQYRRAAGEVLLEIPAGTREPNEDAETCARRELQEETGYEADKIESLPGFYSAPGFSTEYLYCYLMTELKESPGQAEEDENIEIEHYSAEQALQAIRQGEIKDAKSICGILLWLTLGKGK